MRRNRFILLFHSIVILPFFQRLCNQSSDFDYSITHNIKAARGIWFGIVGLLFCSQAVFAQDKLPDLRENLQRQVQHGYYDEAIALLEQRLPAISNDTGGLFDALINLYLFEKNWTGIVDAYATHVSRTGEDTTVLSIARFCSVQPAEVISLRQPEHIPFKPSVSGTPRVKVRINGHSYRFWLDTGAGMTVLSSAVAEQCNVKMMMANDAIAIAGTGKAVELDPGMIDSFEINNLKVYYHPCIILNKKDLEWRILGIPLMKIDGLIGWNFLQEFDVTINNRTDRIYLDAAGAAADQQRNFFWMGDPLISCTDGAGDSCLFTIDTGAGSSAVYQPYLARASAAGAKKKVIMMGSAGGMKRLTSYEIPLMTLKVETTTLQLEKVVWYPHEPNCLFTCDGVIGMQEFEDKSVRFNIRKGFFTVQQ